MNKITLFVRTILLLSTVAFITPSVASCHKHKHINKTDKYCTLYLKKANFYQAIYQKKHHYIYFKKAQYYIAKYNKYCTVPVAPKPTPCGCPTVTPPPVVTPPSTPEVVYSNQGSLKGLVFEDVNNNGKFDNEDRGLKDVRVIVKDSRGKKYRVTTNQKGFYRVAKLPVGDTHIKIATNSLPESAELVVGTKKQVVRVKHAKKTIADKVGFYIPSATATVFGTVYHDINENGTQDQTETGVSNVDVVVTDTEGNDYTARTISSGNWSISNVQTGKATVQVVESTLMKNGHFISGEIHREINVVSGKMNNAGGNGYIITKD